MYPSSAITRGFANIAHGQMHYRTSGTGSPILIIHPSPGSSKQMQTLIRSLAGHGQVFSPDTPGNGDTPALPLEAPTIPDLAAAYLQFLDALQLDRVKLYGSHTGAGIAAELAILAPERIESVVLDGIQVLTPEGLAEVMANYAFPFTPDLDGTYLLRTFLFCRDQYVFYPWYDRTIKGQRSGGLPTPAVLHDWVVEVLKAGETYHLNYRASFQWKALDRLPLVRVPVLVIAAQNDPLVEDTERAAAVLPTPRYHELPRNDYGDFPEVRATAITDFFERAVA